MIPKLFEHNAVDSVINENIWTVIQTHGIGDLIDCITCQAKQTSEGEWELAFRYPVGGQLISELSIGRLICAKVNHWQDEQLFRIYGFEKNMDQTVTINCQHISYDLSTVPVKSFKGEKTDTGQTIVGKMINNIVPVVGSGIEKFSISSSVTSAAQTQEGYFELKNPSTVRSVLLDGDDSIRGCFGGDLVLDNRNVSLVPLGGNDNGVIIEYGVDLIDFTEEENVSEMITGVLPYFRYTNADNDELTAYGNIQYCTSPVVKHKILPLDLTEYFPNQEEHTCPTVAELDAKGWAWMAAEKGIGEPEVSLTLSYASLGQDIRLHDAVTVRFVKMGLDVKSKVTSYNYDVLNERPLEIQVGEAKRSILFSLEDASRLRRGLLPPSRIQNKSITSDKYANNSVTSEAIGSGAVGTGKIASGAVTNSKIENKTINAADKMVELSITAETLASNCVTDGKIASDAVGSDQLKANSVITVKIGDDQVANIKLVQDARNAIAHVWELDGIIAGFVDSQGRISCSTLICQNEQFVPGTFAVLDKNGNTRSVRGMFSPSE